MLTDNTLQVFGLPRSGTNFVEWCIVNYFDDVKYKNVYKPCNVEGIKRYRPNPDAYKHSYPTLGEEKGVIVIYKKHDEWLESYKRAYKHPLGDGVWKKYLEYAKALDENRTYIVEHVHMFYNLEQVLLEISEKFNLTLTGGEHVPPVGRLDRGGAHAKPKNGSGEFKVGDKFRT